MKAAKENEKSEALLTYCDGKSKSKKQRKWNTPFRFPIRQHTGGELSGSAQMWGVSLLLGAPGVGGRLGQKSPGYWSEWGEVSSRFPPALVRRPWQK